MPTYSYRCTKCGHQFDAFHSMSAEPIRICPKENCSGAVEKLFGTGAGILFKGSGFYQTEYKTPPQSGTQCSGCDKAGKCSE